jgi:hypothetical protein
MSHIRTLWCSAAIAAMVTATAAHAELTADDIWQAWQDYAASSGQEMTAGSVSRDGSTFTVNDVSVSSAIEEVMISALIAEIVFEEQTDGSVVISMTDEYNWTLVDDSGDGLVLSVSHPGMRLVASEIDAGIAYDLRAPEMIVTVDEVMGDDAPEELDVTFRVAGLNGQYQVPTDPDGPVSVDLAAAALNAVVRVQDEFTDVDIGYAVSGAGLELRGAGFGLMQEGDPGAALRGGFSIDLGMGFETMRYNFMVEEWGDRTDMSGSSSDGDLRFVMNAEELMLRSNSRNGEMSVAGDQIPFPMVTIKTLENALGFRMPLSGSPDPQDFSVTARVVEATVTEDVWAMFDPMNVIPRTPATLILDLSGQVKLDADLYSEEAAMGMMMIGPDALGELLSVNLGELLVRFAGAELMGEGGFTFDYSDRETFDGIPRPVGVLELVLRGGNTLLDTLVDMGMVPEEEAMGARMMMALFTRPGESEDELLTTLEVREDGAVLANGQRIQ